MWHTIIPLAEASNFLQEDGPTPESVLIHRIRKCEVPPSGGDNCGFDTRTPRWHRTLMRKLIGIFMVMLALTSRAAQPVPDFKLMDVNFNSARPMAQVSPRDYSLQVSGYYFGHAT
jgi:hypothetical protein